MFCHEYYIYSLNYTVDTHRSTLKSWSIIVSPCARHCLCEACLHDTIECLTLCMRAHLLIVQRLAVQESISGRIVLCAGGIPLFLHHEGRFTDSMPSR